MEKTQFAHILKYLREGLVKESVELLAGVAGSVLADTYYSYMKDKENVEKLEELCEAIMHDILEYIHSNEGFPVYFSGIMFITDGELKSAQRNALQEICDKWFASGDMVFKGQRFTAYAIESYGGRTYFYMDTDFNDRDIEHKYFSSECFDVAVQIAQQVCQTAEQVEQEVLFRSFVLY